MKNTQIEKHELNQIEEGMKKKGFLGNFSDLPKSVQRDVWEAGCPAGGKAERVRNEDALRKRIRIEELRKQGLSDEEIYDKIY